MSDKALKLLRHYYIDSRLIAAFSTIVFVLFSSVSARTEQASTLNELIAMFDSSSCKECHEKIYGQWEKSHHARPLMGLDDEIFMAKYLKSGVLAIKPGERATKKNFPCFKCHLPQFNYATDDAAAEIADAILKDDKPKVRHLTISCLICHNEKAVVHGRPAKKVVYGYRDPPEDSAHVVKKSPLLKNSLMCGQCHGLGPNLEFETPVQCATLYGSYLHAYIPSGGTQTCQECHMKDGNHDMPPNFNERTELSERLRQSLPMEVQTLAYIFEPKEGDSRPMAVVKTKITSKAGHRIPDGCPSETKVVLDVTAKAPDGQRIFEGSRIYMPQATDSRSNQMVLGPDKKLGLIRDTSIQPFAPKEETIEIPFPKGVTEAVIEVQLTYQPRPGNIYPIHNMARNVSLDRTK